MHGNIDISKKTVTWYKNIGPSDARFSFNEAMWKEGSRTAALKQIEVPSFVGANWKGQICQRGRALSCFFFSVISSRLSVDPAWIEMNIFMWGVGWYDPYILVPFCTFPIVHSYKAWCRQ